MLVFGGLEAVNAFLASSMFEVRRIKGNMTLMKYNK